MVGCVQFSMEKKSTLLKNVLALIIPLPFHIIGSYSIFTVFRNLDMLNVNADEGEVVEITNLLSLISTAMIFFLRIGYYFWTRNHIKNILFQVGKHEEWVSEKTTLIKYAV